MKKAFLVSSNGRITDWLMSNFGIATVKNFEDAEIVVFPGGLDVDPNLYNEPTGQRTSYNRAGDSEWVSWYKEAIRHEKKVLGICKGSQFLTVMSGGALFQHVTGHGLSGRHSIAIDGKTYHVTSTHHQMMNPYNLEEDDFEVLAFSEEKLSKVYLNGYDDELDAPKQELEAVFYKGNGALAIQFHPEFMEYSDPVQKVIEGWLKKTERYTPESFFDKYKRKRSTSGSKGTFKDIDLGDVSEDLFEEFVNHYLK